MSAEAIANEMAEHVEALGRDGVSVKDRIWRAARATGLTPGQIKRLRYGEWRVIPAHIADQIRAARRAQEERLNEAAKREYRSLEERIAAVEALLRNADEDRAGDPETSGSAGHADSAVDR